MLSLFGFAAIVTAGFSGLSDVAARHYGVPEMPLRSSVPAQPPVRELAAPSVPVGRGPGYGISVAGPTVSLEWKNWILGRSIGRRGLYIADLDGDSLNEVITSASKDSGVAQLLVHTRTWLRRLPHELV